MAAGPRSRIKTALHVRLIRDGLAPSHVPVAVLSRLLQAIGSLGGESAKPSESPDDVGAFQLVQVKNGSALYALSSGSERAIERLRVVGKILEGAELPTDIEGYLRPIEEISHVAHSLRCVVELCPSDCGVIARIEPDSYPKLAKRVFVQGDATLFGRIERVGGVTRTKCSLRIAGRAELLYCRVESKELARSLGQHLYQQATVQGIATWVRTNWSLHEFLIQAATPFRPRPLLEAMRALHDAGGSAWDRIDDVDAFVQDIRSE